MTASDIEELAASDFRKRYRVVAKLGEGGMALVHLAVVRGVAGVRKLVVLKSVRPELVSDAGLRNMFVAEARLAATLSHPNIVQTFEVVLSKGRPVLVMEYLDGQPFARVVKSELREQDTQSGLARRQALGSRPLALQLYVLKETLSGLEYVHNSTDLDGTPLNLVHRDMSPQNVFVTYEGQVKILDFGIAKVVGSTGHTETGEIKGKIRYMAPEQMVGSVHLDRRADIFSVGVMLWEVLTQRRLWENMPDVMVIQAVVNGSVPAPSTVAEGVAPRLDAICRRALANDPDQRYQTAAEMQQDLENAIDELGLSISTRQVGKTVAGTFAELRASIKNVLETQLKDEKAAPINLLVSENDGVLAEEAGMSGDLWGLPSAVSVTGSSSTKSARRRRAVSLAAGAAALLGGAAFVGFGHFARSQPPRAHVEAPATVVPPPVASPPPVVAPTATAPKHVHVQIAVEPPTAKLFFDDALLGSESFSGEMNADGVTHTLRVEAPGYRTQVIAVPLDRPLATKVKLEPVPQVAVGTFHAPPRTAATTTATPSASTAAAGLCAVPYYFDEQGIKRVRPECLK